MNIQDLSASYKGFLSQSQTERLCVRTIIAALEKNGFSLMNRSSSLSDGDKVYEVIKGKTVFAAIVGKEPDKIRLVGSHIDSPKLDLKANPLYGKGNLLMLSLHDYGWIKPYQWVNTPLGLYGLVILKDGTELPVDLKDTAFSIADIPPHISRDQLKQPMSEGFAVSQLNAIGGCLDGSDSQSSVEEKVYGLLKEAYGIEKEDFAVADLCLLPKNEPMDVGFDHALIGAYGQDDRICAFTSLSALLATSEPRHTALSWFVDKEEVASTGDTSAQSFALRNFLRRYSALFTEQKFQADDLLENAQAISADVTTAFDPNFPEKFDETNHADLGKGVVVEKNGAAGSGKFRANEARAEYAHVIRTLLDQNHIAWQTGALAKLGVGGGGTISPFLSRYGLDCIDAGPAILGMHSPFELSSKFDLMSTTGLYQAFFAS